METRKTVINTDQGGKCAVEGVKNPICVAVPIVSAGDVCGAVVFAEGERSKTAADSDIKLATVAAAFLGKQMEG